MRARGLACSRSAGSRARGLAGSQACGLACSRAGAGVSTAPPPIIQKNPPAQAAHFFFYYYNTRSGRQGWYQQIHNKRKVWCVGGLVWGLVWVGLGWFRACSRSRIDLLNSTEGICVCGCHLAAFGWVGLGLVLLGLWLVFCGFLSKTNISNYVHRCCA